MVTTRFDKRLLLVALGLVLVLLAFLPGTPSHAQTYRFSLPTYEVEAYIEADGSLTEGDFVRCKARADANASCGKQATGKKDQGARQNTAVWWACLAQFINVS